MAHPYKIGILTFLGNFGWNFVTNFFVYLNSLMFHYCQITLAERLARLAFYHRSGSSQVGGSNPGGIFFKFSSYISTITYSLMNLFANLWNSSEKKYKSLPKNGVISSNFSWKRIELLFLCHLLHNFGQNSHLVALIFKKRFLKGQKNLVTLTGFEPGTSRSKKKLGTRLMKISLKIHILIFRKFKQDFLTNLCPHWSVVSSHTKIITEYHRIFLCTVLCSTQ